MGMGATAIVALESVSQYSSSRMHNEPKKIKEASDAYEERTWREKAHCDANGNVIIPSMAFKFCLIAAARYLGEKVPDKKGKTWTGYFTSAVMIDGDLKLPLKKEQLDKVHIPAHVSGDRKSGRRVLRTFPVVLQWQGSLRVIIYDETITPQVFERVFGYAGAFIGIGRFRPENGGYNGRFAVKSIQWKRNDE